MTSQAMCTDTTASASLVSTLDREQGQRTGSPKAGTVGGLENTANPNNTLRREVG